jgi:hypothetical protein
MSLRKIAGATAALWLAAVCAGCALAPEQTAEAPEAKQYRTGSNIPVKEGQASEVKTVDPKSIQLERPRGVGSAWGTGG